MPASRASSKAWRTADAAVSVIGSIVEPRHTIIHSDIQTDNGDRHQLFGFHSTKPMLPNVSATAFNRMRLIYPPILGWSPGFLEISAIWRLKSYARTRGLSV